MHSPSDFDFAYDDPIDKSLFPEESARVFPGITWHGKHGQSPTSVFTLDESSVEGIPGPFWDAASVQYGSNPNAPLVECYQTGRLRGVPIAVRRRIIISAADGSERTYPWKTPKEGRAEGKFKSHYQILLQVPGLVGDGLVVLGLRGLAKTASWDNPEAGRYRDARFPTGVEQHLRAYAAAATRQRKAWFPWLCAWVIDLVPQLNDKGKPVFVNVGNEVYMNPFTVDLRTDKEERMLPRTRFVGAEPLKALLDLRREIGAPWEQEWLVPSASTTARDQFGPDPLDQTPADDGIPF